MNKILKYQHIFIYIINIYSNISHSLYYLFNIRLIYFILRICPLRALSSMIIYIISSNKIFIGGISKDITERMELQ